MKGREKIASSVIGIGIGAALILSEQMLDPSITFNHSDETVQDYTANQILQIAQATDQNGADQSIEPLIVAHPDKQQALTEILIENSLLLEPVCSNLFINADISDIKPSVDSDAIAHELQQSKGQTDVNVCIDPNVELNTDGDIVLLVNTQPELLEGSGRTNLYLSLSNEIALRKCETAVVNMSNEVFVRIDKLQEIHGTDQESINVRISQENKHPCDTATQRYSDQLGGE